MLDFVAHAYNPSTWEVVEWGIRNSKTLVCVPGDTISNKQTATILFIYNPL